MHYQVSKSGIVQLARDGALVSGRASVALLQVYAPLTHNNRCTAVTAKGIGSRGFPDFLDIKAATMSIRCFTLFASSFKSLHVVLT
jgi:hypothetical protein